MKEIKNGTVEVITFRTTREDSSYGVPLKAITSGTSTGHIALRITFEDRELFEEYIAGNPRIPHQSRVVPYKFTNSLNKDDPGKNNITDHFLYKTEYEVYLSFWPLGEWSYNNEASSLVSYTYDCEQSANGTPIEYAQNFLHYLQPLKKLVSYRLPLPQSLTLDEIYLAPSITLHTTRLGMAFGTVQNGSLTPTPNHAIMYAAEQYAKRYNDWRSNIIYEQNAQFTYNDKHDSFDIDMLARFSRQTKISKIRALNAEKKLMSLMYPEKKLSHDDFMQKLEPFITFGWPERDTVTLDATISVPYTNAKPECTGLQLEPMLAMIKNIADHPKDYPYSLFSSNCANTAFNVLWEGIKNTDNSMLKEQFLEAREQYRLSIAVTPTMVIKDAAQAKAANEVPENRIVLRTKQGVDLCQNPDCVRFTKKYADELPTTRTELLAEFLNQAAVLRMY